METVLPECGSAVFFVGHAFSGLLTSNLGPDCKYYWRSAQALFVFGTSNPAERCKRCSGFYNVFYMVYSSVSLF